MRDIVGESVVCVANGWMCLCVHHSHPGHVSTSHSLKNKYKHCFGNFKWRNMLFDKTFYEKIVH
jgi:hypothetical protein